MVSPKIYMITNRVKFSKQKEQKVDSRIVFCDQGNFNNTTCEYREH